MALLDRDHSWVSVEVVILKGFAPFTKGRILTCNNIKIANEGFSLDFLEVKFYPGLAQEEADLCLQSWQEGYLDIETKMVVVSMSVVVMVSMSVVVTVMLMLMVSYLAALSDA